MNYPKISIAIATYNSKRTLEKTLDSIVGQDYPRNKIEILAIDGGSKDNTLQIARKYKCKIIPNPRTELIYAKHIGYLKAAGKYLIFLDHDEILENPQSLKIKLAAMTKDPRVRSALPSGYKTPEGFSDINYYTNEFGDPFTFFIYRESKSYQFLLGELSKKYPKVAEDENCALFDFHQVKQLPLIELWAGGCMVDIEYARANFPQVKKDPSLVAHLFYLLNSKKALLAVTKNDPTVHNSSEKLAKFLKKLDYRIKINMRSLDMGKEGFLGRENFQASSVRMKKYLFVPYSLSVILPAIDALYLFITRKKFIYLVHLPLCIYITYRLGYYLSRKALNKNLNL